MKVKFLDGTKRAVRLEFGANLRGADLYDADLQGADLRGADLWGADLRGADLYGANLYGANLYGANLRCANLRGANLRCANLWGVDLWSADLRGANLWGVDLQGANLQHANLRGADLQGADLKDAKGLDSFSILPAGVLIGYKKLANGKIAVLRIPEKARRVNAYGSRKCRASYAVVVAGSGVSQRDATFKYAKGKTVRPVEPFCDDPRIECGSGIHFFITRQEAIDY